MARLCHRIVPGLTGVRTEGFPSFDAKPSSSSGTEVWLGIGGNLGDPVRRFQHLRHYLKRQSDLKLLESSPILINPPFGYRDQPDFANAVLRIRTRLAPQRLLRRLQEIERKFGRKRSFKDAPRTLDIDLIFYGCRRIGHPRLWVPHPGWRRRVSVRWPLSHLRRSGPGDRIRRELKPLRLLRSIRAAKRVTEH